MMDSNDSDIRKDQSSYMGVIKKFQSTLTFGLYLCSRIKAWIGLT